MPRDAKTLWPLVEAAQRDGKPRAESGDERSGRAEAHRIDAAANKPPATGGPVNLDQASARALAEAGLMPLADYIAMVWQELAQTHPQASADRSRRRLPHPRHWVAPKALRRLTQRKRRA